MLDGDQPTDRPTDKAGCSVACIRLKTRLLILEKCEWELNSWYILFHIFPEFLNFLQPFTTNLWLLCVACFISYSLIFYFIIWANHSLLKTRNRVISLGQSLSFFGTAFIQQESEYKPSSFGEILLSVTWRIFSIMMLATYTANLVST